MSRHGWIFGLLFFGTLLAAPLLAVAPACAQQTDVPRQPAAPAPGTPAPKGNGLTVTDKLFDAQHLKDRPYTGKLPPPSFPTTERVQRAFTISFVYDYAFATYTPSPAMPVVSKALTKRDTPENAAIAFFSAQRSGDWDAFLQCWAEADRKRIQEMVKTQKFTVAELLGKWKQYYGNKTVSLVDRIETMDYVILDVAVSGTSAQLPAVFKSVDGQWMATNDLGNSGNPMLGEFRPELGGIVRHMQPVPMGDLSGARRPEAEAQRAFVEEHNQRSEIVRAGR